jgi:hypothetical protein
MVRRVPLSRLGSSICSCHTPWSAGIVVSPLDAGQATAVLAAACNPDTVLPPTPGLAAPDEIITTPASPFDPYHLGNLGNLGSVDSVRAGAATPGEHWADDWPPGWADEGGYAIDDEVGQRGWTA